MKVIVFAFICLLLPVNVHAAEVLQVRHSSLLQIGDQNRNYTVRIACIDIDEDQSDEALSWLKLNLARKTRVNLRPLSSNNGVLIARVIPLGSEIDISTQMIEQGLGQSSC